MFLINIGDKGEIPFDLHDASSIIHTRKTESSSPITDEYIIPSSNLVNPIRIPIYA
jgi:hypothetical protein